MRHNQGQIIAEPITSRQPKRVSLPHQKSKKKSAIDSPFQRYMKKYYFEHFRRVMSGRRAARWVLFSYPFFSTLVFAAPFIASVFIVEQLYRKKPEWFVNVLSPDSQVFVMPILYGLIAVAFALGLITGIALGISRARFLTFEVEKIEMSVRQNYFLRRIGQSLRRS